MTLGQVKSHEAVYVGREIGGTRGQEHRIRAKVFSEYSETLEKGLRDLVDHFLTLEDVVRLCVWQGFPVKDEYLDLIDDAEHICPKKDYTLALATSTWLLTDAVRALFGDIGKYWKLEHEFMAYLDVQRPTACEFGDHASYKDYAAAMLKCKQMHVNEKDYGTARTIEYEMACAAIAAGEIEGSPRTIPGTYYVNLKSIIKWAVSKGYVIPKDFRILHEDLKHEIVEAKTLENDGEPATDITENEFVLAPGGEVWRVRFQGGPQLTLRKTKSDGMALVACLLRTPGKKWKAEDLFLEVSGGYIQPENIDKAAAKTYGTGGAARDFMMSKAGIKKTREMRNGLQEEINLHNSGEIILDIKTFEDKEEQLEIYNGLLDKVARKDGKAATIKDDHDKIVNYIGTNLPRVYLRIAKAELEKEPSHNRKRKVDNTDINAQSTPLAFHLSKCIAPYSKKLYYCYEPDIEITWEA